VDEILMSYAEEVLKLIEDGWARLGVEIDANIQGRGGELHLSRIEVEKSRRNQGYGSKAMEDLTHFADAHELVMTLSPATDFGATSKERLKRFYRRFGFVSNKSRNKKWQISDSMYRLPQGP
jgi:ribosomal protein S18 acetylase RimI-like enzyme